MRQKFSNLPHFVVLVPWFRRDYSSLTRGRVVENDVLNSLVPQKVFVYLP